MSGEGKVPAPAGPRGAFKNSRKSRNYGFRTASALTLAALAPLGLISIRELEGIVAPPPPPPSSPRLQSPGWEQEDRVHPYRSSLVWIKVNECVSPPGREKKRKIKKLTPNRKFLLPGALFTDAAAETSPFPRSHQLEEDTPRLSPV